MRIIESELTISMTLGELQSLLGLTRNTTDTYMYEQCGMKEEDVLIVHNFNESFSYLVKENEDA